ncbi:uncharacterized protein EI90DRAFT_3072977, partial [Cantharellus anzutake]|uniref:uncharacterized protein n=1 Tax=Cantharellus anzutake TaxID=1750568 RepID=UPI001904161B
MRSMEPTRSFSFECNNAQSSYPSDSGRVKAAEVLEPDRKFTTQRRLEHQRGSPPHLQPPAPRRHSPPRTVATEPKLGREMAQEVENYAAEVAKLRQSRPVESKERTPEVNASTQTSKRRQMDEDRTARKNDVRDKDSAFGLVRVHQSKDPPAERGDWRITDGVIYEVFEYKGSPRRVALPCDGISKTWTDDSKER